MPQGRAIGEDRAVSN